MVLVTGGTGLVGSHLLLKLVQKSQRVRAIYRNENKIATTKHVFSYYSDNANVLMSKIDWVYADITDIPSLIQAFNNITHVYHCAAYISFDPKYYHSIRQINIDGTANIVNLCLSNNIQKLCYISSIAAIGAQDNKKPKTEESPWSKSEDHSIYAITKYGAEMEVWRGSQEGLNTVIVNPGIIIGPGYWRSGSGSFFKRIYKGQKYYTNGVTGYVSVDDVVDIMIQLMEGIMTNQRYILVAENLTFKAFFTKIALALNVPIAKREATPFILNMAWRLDWIRCKLKRKHRKLVKQNTHTFLTISKYNASKIKAELDYTFMPIDLSISSTSQYFLQDEERFS